MVFWQFSIHTPFHDNELPMKKVVLLLLALAIVLGVAYASYPVARDGVTLHLTNAGADTMRQVVVHVTGRSYAVGDIAPGASAAIVLHPRGESDIELAQSGHPRLIIGCYLESGYKGSINATATTERIVAVDSKVIFAAY